MVYRTNKGAMSMNTVYTVKQYLKIMLKKRNHIYYGIHKCKVFHVKHDYINGFIEMYKYQKKAVNSAIKTLRFYYHHEHDTLIVVSSNGCDYTIVYPASEVSFSGSFNEILTDLPDLL